jgi:hypothetical protein
MRSDGSMPTTEPPGTRSAISAVIFPSPQPMSRTRSAPESSRPDRHSSASHFCIADRFA